MPSAPKWPTDLPLFVRLSCSDYTPGGLTIEDNGRAVPQGSPRAAMWT